MSAHIRSLVPREEVIRDRGVFITSAGLVRHAEVTEGTALGRDWGDNGGSLEHL